MKGLWCMRPYLIYTDAAADFPPDFFPTDALRIIPMTYIMDGKEYVFNTGTAEHDRLCDEFYQALKNGADVKTTQVTQFQYEESFSIPLSEGEDILYLCFSSGMSNMYNNAVLAAEQLREDYPDRKMLVVDTRAATQGQGVFVRSALLNRDNGMSIEENAAWLNEKMPYICHRFLVGDLHHLHKGGRLSAAAAVVGTMLKIKPLLIINDEGKLEVFSKARGLKLAEKRIVEGTKREQGVPDVPKIIHIGHTSMYEEAERLRDAVREIVEEGTIIDIVNMGPIIGAHCGPELLSICGWGLHRRENGG